MKRKLLKNLFRSDRVLRQKYEAAFPETSDRMWAIRSAMEMTQRELAEECGLEFMPDDDDVLVQNEILNNHEIICPQCAELIDPNIQKSTLILQCLTYLENIYFSDNQPILAL